MIFKKWLSVFFGLNNILTFVSVFLLALFLFFPKAAWASTVTYSITSGPDDSTLDLFNGPPFSNTDQQVKMGKDGSFSVNNFVRFVNIAIPQGSTITSARLSFSGIGESYQTVNLQLAAFAGDTAVAPTDTSSFTTYQNSLTTARVNWDVVPVQTWGQVLTSPDISPVIQEIVNRAGWASGNNTMIWIGDHGSSSSAKRFYFGYEYGGGEQKMRLAIAFDPPVSNTPTSVPSTPIPTQTPTPPPPTAVPSSTPIPSPTATPTPLPNGTPTTVISTLTVSADDSTYAGTGTFSSTANWPEMGMRDSTNASNNLFRFNAIHVPQGATITSSTLTYVNVDASTVVVNLQLAAVNSDNPTSPTSESVFLAYQNNLTASRVNWDNLPVVAWGDQSTSPDISVLVQEVVNRQGWLLDNSLIIWVGNHGSSTYAKRKYISADYSGGEAKPKLSITYLAPENPTPTIAPTVTPSPTPTTPPASTPTNIPPTPTLIPPTPTNSPPSPTPTPNPLITSMTRTLTAGSDDTSYDGSTFSDNGTQVSMGKSMGSTSINNFFHFTDLPIPQGSTITSAYFSYSNYTANTTVVNLQFAAANSDNAASPTSDVQFDAYQNNLTTARVNWDALPIAAYGSFFTSPDLTPVIQEIVSWGGWHSGNDLLLWIGDHGSDSWAQRKYLSADYAGKEPKPQLVVSYIPGIENTPTPSPTLPPGITPSPTPSPTPIVANLRLSSKITAGGDDCTFNSKLGTLDCSTNWPSMGNFDPGHTANNLFKFGNITIPSGSQISSAYFTFKSAANIDSGVVNLQFSAVNGNNPTSPASTDQFIADQENLTTARVNWDQVPFRSWGTATTSPDIATIVQEIINTAGWQSGNNLLLWVGDNRSANYANRKYSAYEAGSADAISLVINYTPPNVSPIAVGDAINVISGDTVIIDVLANDYDNEGDSISLAQAAQPLHGSTSLSNGKVLYTSQANFSGSDSFSYTIIDSRGATSQSTVNVTVLPHTGRYSVHYLLDKSAVPDLYYQDLTLTLYVGIVSNVTVLADHKAISSSYNPTTKTIMFTTSGSDIQISFDKASSISEIGPLTKATLKYDKKWAWSFSMDDNTGLKPSILNLQKDGFRATLYLIANKIDMTRQQDWIVDAPDLKTLLGQGWALGDHTWNHECSGYTSEQYRTTIMQSYNLLKTISADSSVPEYKLLSFAAPCYASEYHSIIQQMISEKTTDLRFNESGNTYQMIVDQGATSYSSGLFAATPFSYTADIGRDPILQDGAPGVATAKLRLDWMAAHATTSRHFWYNSFTHGNSETAIGTFADYAYSTYGSGGTDELLMAPAEEIYSYLLVRDNTSLTYEGVTSLTTAAPTPTASPISSPQIHYISPAAAINDSSDVSFTLYADALQNNTEIMISSKSSSLHATDVIVINSATAVGHFNVLGASPGSYSITITNPDTGTVSTPNAFQISAAVVPSPTAIPTATPTIADTTVVVSTNSAVINFTTNVPTSNKINFGVNPALGWTTGELNSGYPISYHSMTLENLTRCTRYYYQVHVKDAQHTEATDIQRHFSTAGCLGDAVILGEGELSPSLGSDTITDVVLDGNNKMTLSLPAGFTQFSNTTFQVKHLTVADVLQSAPAPINSEIVNSQIMDIKFYDVNLVPITTFDKSITITLYYDRTTLGMFDENGLKIYWWNGTSWQALTNCQVNTGAQSVSCSSSHLTTFALFGSPAEKPLTLFSSASSTQSTQTSPARFAPHCSSSSPLGAPELFQINTLKDTAWIHLVPINWETKDYYIAFGENANAEGNGTHFYLGSAPTGALIFTVDHLQLNTTYYFKARGQTGCVPGQWSSIYSIKTDGGNELTQLLPIRKTPEIQSKIDAVVHAKNNTQFSSPKQPPSFTSLLDTIIHWIKSLFIK